MEEMSRTRKLIQTYKVASAEIRLSEILDALLTGFDRIGHEIVEAPQAVEIATSYFWSMVPRLPSRPWKPSMTTRLFIRMSAVSTLPCVWVADKLERASPALPGVGELGSDLGLLRRQLLQLELDLLRLLLEVGLLGLACLELLELGLAAFLDRADLRLHLLESHRSGVGFLLEDGHLALGNGDGRLLLVDLLLPRLQTSSCFGGNRIGEGLGLALQALSDGDSSASSFLIWSSSSAIS